MESHLEKAGEMLQGGLFLRKQSGPKCIPMRGGVTPTHYRNCLYHFLEEGTLNYIVCNTACGKEPRHSHVRSLSGHCIVCLYKSALSAARRTSLLLLLSYMVAASCSISFLLLLLFILLALSVSIFFACPSSFLTPTRTKRIRRGLLFSPHPQAHKLQLLNLLRVVSNVGDALLLHPTMDAFKTYIPP
jgi:hypothetical protein